MPIELHRRHGRGSPAKFGIYDRGKEIGEAAAPVASRTMLSEAGLAILYQQVAHVERERIGGSIVECGVWHGGSSGLMARASLDHGDGTRTFHLFDSFEGIPEPIALVDGPRAVREVGGEERARGRLQVAYDYADRGGPGSEGETRALFQHVGYAQRGVHVHQGWFQDTVPRVANSIGRIALLHLDGDWYESTGICLEYLYEHVSPGGFVTVNDYGAYNGCQCAVDEFFATIRPRPFLTHVDREIRFWIK